jgi:hypothetical protein
MRADEMQPEQENDPGVSVSRDEAERLALSVRQQSEREQQPRHEREQQQQQQQTTTTTTTTTTDEPAASPPRARARRSTRHERDEGRGGEKGERGDDGGGKIRRVRARVLSPSQRSPATSRLDAQERALVIALAAQGVDRQTIAHALGISAKTLGLRYAQELRRAALEANARVGKALLDAATAAVSYKPETDARGQPTGRMIVDEVRPAGVTAAIWWTKARMGWAERQELTGKGGGPLRVAHLEGIGKL